MSTANQLQRNTEKQLDNDNFTHRIMLNLINVWKLEFYIQKSPTYWWGAESEDMIIHVGNGNEPLRTPIWTQLIDGYNSSHSLLFPTDPSPRAIIENQRCCSNKSRKVDSQEHSTKVRVVSQCMPLTEMSSCWLVWGKMKIAMGSIVSAKHSQTISSSRFSNPFKAGRILTAYILKTDGHVDYVKTTHLHFACNFANWIDCLFESKTQSNVDCYINKLLTRRMQFLSNRLFERITLSDLQATKSYAIPLDQIRQRKKSFIEIHHRIIFS